MRNAFFQSSLRLLRDAAQAEPGVGPALRALEAFQTPEGGIQAGVEDFLSNPFVQTALSILKSFSKNYKVQEAIKLLREAGKEHEEEEHRKSRRR